MLDVGEGSRSWLVSSTLPPRTEDAPRTTTYDRSGFVSYPTIFRHFVVRPCSRGLSSAGPRTLGLFTVISSPLLTHEPEARNASFSPTRVRRGRPRRNLLTFVEEGIKALCDTPEYRRLKAREAILDEQLRLVRQAEPRPLAALPAKTRSMIEEALRLPDDSVVISKFSIDFCRKDLATLRSPRWLNDEVINFYLQLISLRSEKSQGALPSLHVFSSFFYPKLRDRGYEAVRTSTRRVSPPVTSRDMVLFPIHLGAHWCLAVIDFPEKTISYYDSLHGRNEQCLRILCDWLARESLDKRQVEFDFAGWRENWPSNVPSQQNGHDCGVFALAFAEHISRRAALSFSQDDMLYWRDRIAYEILTGMLLE